MKVYRILGSKKILADKGQIALMTFFFFVGAVSKSIVLLVICPAVIFAAAFFVREKAFSGKPEWWIFVLRMFGGGREFYCRQFRDRVDGGGK